MDIRTDFLELIKCIHEVQATPSNGVALISTCISIICTFNCVRIIKVDRLLVTEAHGSAVLTRILDRGESGFKATGVKLIIHII